MSKISIIIPIYNAADTLEAAIRSALGAAEDAEIIAVDDGSTDASLSLLEAFARGYSRLTVLRTPVRSGVSAARNLALAQASGEYVAFCDADDTVAPGAYDKLARAMEKTDADAASGLHLDVTRDGEALGPSLKVPRRSSAFGKLFSPCTLWNKLYRRSFLERYSLRFDEGRSVGEDVVFLCGVCAAAPKVVHLPEVVYYHIFYPTEEKITLNHVYTAEKFREHLDCRRVLLERLGQTDPEVRRYVYLSMGQFLQDFFLTLPGEDALGVYDEYRAFLLGWHEADGGLFRALFGLSREELSATDARAYTEMIAARLAEQTVADKFASGRLGMRWIIKYLRAWAKFKFSRASRMR